MESSRRFFHIAALLACFVIVHGAAATPYEIRFQSGSFLPESGLVRIPESQAERAHALMQLENYLSAGQQDALTAAGVELLQYLPDRAYVVSVRKNADAAGLKALGVRYLDALKPEQKIHPRVTLGQFGKWSEYSQDRRILSVDVMPDVSLDEAAVQLEQTGCEVGHRFEAAHTLLIAVDPSVALDIAALDVVLFVNESSPPLDKLNNDARARLHVNELRLAPYNLTGNGVIAFVFDGDMADSTHPDFGGRLRWMEAGATADHATHTSGTLGGSGQVSGGTYAGMAPQARIISGAYNQCDPYCFYESANDIEPDYTIARTVHHVEVSSNSVGANIDPNNLPTAWFGDYETTSRLVDRLVRNTAGAPLMQFWAAGNERHGENYNWPSYGCMSIPAGSKNIITCGWADNADAISFYSSWGPTDDGRVKPEVSATGEDVTSCIVGGGYGAMSGTSMATPASAGVACLILQEWHQLFPESPDPLPETMKAILINSATDVGAVGPDYQSGYGIVNALKAVQNLIAGGMLESSLEISETFTHTFTVPAGLSALDVSLAWSDVPGASMVIPTLVNDLDLELQAPNATLYYPWKLRPTQPGTAATTGIDSVNVCERVHVASPAAGTWTLRVRGRLNSGTSQTFGLSANVALVTSWAGITGQIRNAVGGQGIPGRISLVGGSLSAVTDTSGSFMFSVPANAQYTFLAESYGFAPHDTTLTITTGPIVLDLPMTSAQNGTINGTVTNQFGYHLVGAEVQISFPGATIPPVTAGAGGTFSVALPGGVAYDVLASYGGWSEQVSVFVPVGGAVNPTLTISHPKFRAAGPDFYGYYAYEIGDSASDAFYDWLEISPNAGGPGTLIPSGGGNDWIAPVTTPFSIRYYGQTTNQIQVGADGWIRVGGAEVADSVYANRDIPNPRVPNGIVCLFWDDLYPYDPTAGGDISYYDDQANGRFIIEYHLVPHYTPRTNLTTAQLVFYNTTVRPTVSGDNEFLMQYQRLDREDGTEDADATIGIEDFEGDDGIEVAFDVRLNAACFEPTPQSAILFSPGGIPGLGAVQGDITMIPPPPDWSAVTAAVGTHISHPDNNGAFLIDSVPPGSYALVVSLAGYETGRVETLVIAVDDTAQAAFTLYRLDPATNLIGEYNWETQQIYLHWNWPAWHSSQLMTNPRGGDHLDIFRNFRVWIAGLGLQGSPSDTFFTYTVRQSRSFRFWVETVYDGGTADTSNNFRITIDLSAEQMSGAIPTEFYLKQNYPNPFNPLTMIEYGLPKTARVTVEVFDVLGRKVAVLHDGMQEPGAYRVAFDGAGLGSGVYYCRLKTAEFERVQKMLLMR